MHVFEAFPRRPTARQAQLTAGLPALPRRDVRARRRGRRHGAEDGGDAGWRGDAHRRHLQPARWNNLRADGPFIVEIYVAPELFWGSYADFSQILKHMVTHLQNLIEIREYLTYFVSKSALISR